MSETDLQTVLNFLVESTPTELLPHTDVILVCGHYEPKIAEHASELWWRGCSHHVVLSGKGRDKIPEGYSSEADFYHEILLNNGVVDSSILLEKKATNTLENVIFGMGVAEECFQLVYERPLRSVIVCAMPPLLRRTLATFRKQFPNLSIFGSGCEIPEEWVTSARVQRLLGELGRLHDYAEKGDIVRVEVPDDVLTAAERLRH